MSLNTGAHVSSPAHDPGFDAWQASMIARPSDHDVIPVPRGILERLLTHVLAGNKRFPTRHLSQAIQMLHHILGAPGR
ncbi:MAG TPA: hypothetical protein VNL77_14790 [Roseiflexaceae bacterium]|nr:hypothetical protein [Roseiflexaceae bacterium]